MSTVHDGIKSAQAIVSIAALIIGGIWAFNEFVRERPHNPRADVKFAAIKAIRLPGNLTLLRSDVEISNSGLVSITIDDSQLKVQQILPLVSGCSDSDEDVRRCLEESELTMPVDGKQDAPRFQWPTIILWEGSPGPPPDPVLLEPGETHGVDFEVLIPSDVDVVRLYMHVANNRLSQPGREYGWSVSTYFDLRTVKDEWEAKR